VKAAQFYDLVSNPRFTYTLVQTRYESNRPVIGETLMCVLAKYRPEAVEKFNPSRFLAWHLTGLLESRTKGIDTAAAEAEAHAALDTLSPSDRDTVRKRVMAYKERLTAPAGTNPRWRRRTLTAVQTLLLRAPIFLPIVAALTRRYGIDVFGPRIGIDEIPEFVKFVDQSVSRSQVQEGRVAV
jgi:hypothetical protein